MRNFMRCLNYFVCLLASLITFNSIASNAIGVTNIKILEQSYSKITLVGTFNYDGQLGDSNFFGAEAITSAAVSGSSFKPNRIDKGFSEIQFTIERPMSNSIDSFTSQSILFTVYNRKESLKKTIDFELSWPSFDQYFEISKTAQSKHQFHSIRTLTIDESFKNAKTLIQDIVASGVLPKNIRIVSVADHSKSNSEPGFQFAETITFNDFKHFAKLLSKNDIPLNNIAFIKLKQSNFDIGNINILPAGRAAYTRVDQEPLSVALNNDTFDPLFKLVNFDGAPRGSLNKQLLEKAISLNNKGNRKGGEKAHDIVEYLIDVGFDNSRIYAELARAYGRMYNYNEYALQKRRTVLNLALSLYPNDQWAHALLAYDETFLGNYESAERHIKLASKHEKERNVWTIVNWARLHEAKGELPEAHAKYQELIGLDHLSDSNKVAHRRGLNFFSSLLEAEHDNSVADVYRELIASYPLVERCVKVKLAHNLLTNENDSSEVEALLNDISIKDCKGIDATEALLGLKKWYQKGATTPIQPIIISHGDLATLIYEASSMPDGLALLMALKEKNIDLAFQNPNGLNALHLSIAARDKSASLNLLESNIDINSRLPNGWTPLMIAVYINSAELVKLLLKNGADKSIKANDGISAIHIAQQSGQIDIIKVLENTSS